MNSWRESAHPRSSLRLLLVLTIGFIMWTVIPDSFMQLLVYLFLQQLFLEHLLCSGHCAKAGAHCWAGWVLLSWWSWWCAGGQRCENRIANGKITAVASASRVVLWNSWEGPLHLVCVVVLAAVGCQGGLPGGSDVAAEIWTVFHPSKSLRYQ